MHSTKLDRRYGPIFAAASVAAHAGSGDSGFRQKDLKFLIELFTNWISHTLPGRVVPVQSTQVKRFLEELGGEGYARRIGLSEPPHYRLTRIGLLELLERISDPSWRGSPEQFLFVFYFIRNYRTKIETLIKSEGRQFPTALKIEIEYLLDAKQLLTGETKRVQREILKLKARASDAENSAELAQRLFQEGHSEEAVTKQLEERYPYELNAEKPLSELFRNLPHDLRRWELEIGNRRRAEGLWGPSIQLLAAYLEVLRNLDPR